MYELATMGVGGLTFFWNFLGGEEPPMNDYMLGPFHSLQFQIVRSRFWNWDETSHTYATSMQ